MKITTWNVNGLRAALGKGILGWVEEYQPDILCLQEVRSRPEQIESQYHQVMHGLYPSITWHPANRPGYSGVAMFHRAKPIAIQVGMGIPDFDNEGRLIMSRLEQYLLFGIYFPHGGHDHSRVPFKLDFYARLLDWCNHQHSLGEKIILCGDFNTCHQDIDLRNPKDNANTSGYLPEERVWIDYYLEHGFVDIYRLLYPDRVQYTWWTYRMNVRERNVGWRLDYFLVSNDLVNCIQDVIIHEDVTGSDHCPVTLLLK